MKEKMIEKRIKALEGVAHSGHSLDEAALDAIADRVLAKLIARIDGIAEQVQAEESTEVESDT